LHIIKLNTVSSTNDIAKAEVKSRGSVYVVAENQTKGRGRNKNAWYGNPGENLYCSFGILHKRSPSLQRLVIYQVAAALAVKESLLELSNLDVFRIKYPNDILAKTPGGYRKICGILIEHEFLGNKCLSSVTGIGINVMQTDFPSEIKNTATSLSLLGSGIKPDDLLHVLISKYKKYNRTRMEEVFTQWKAELGIEGKKAEIINSSGIWTIKKIQRDCRLLLINDSNSEQRLIDDADTIRYNVD
jgi:BirA family biotin operon repressor/biotin-[acetyl-CoA-carboxylase] ligase